MNITHARCVGTSTYTWRIEALPEGNPNPNQHDIRLNHAMVGYRISEHVLLAGVRFGINPVYFKFWGSLRPDAFCKTIITTRYPTGVFIHEVRYADVVPVWFAELAEETFEWVVTNTPCCAVHGKISSGELQESEAPAKREFDISDFI